MFCSTIIPTTNRPSLSIAVRSVLDQDFSGHREAIVVNDSGEPLPQMDWQNCNHVRVIDTNRRERSVARNAGAALAKGEFLHFLDDDDVMLPGALTAFCKLAHDHPDAAWLYGSYQTMDNDGNIINEFHPNIIGNIFPQLISGEAVPFQASLLRTRAFYAAGGFDPALVGVEDRDMGRRIAISGDVARTRTIVARIRIGEAGSTTNWKSLAEGDRRGREKAMIQSGALRRLWESRMSSYWRGRVTRAYIASTVWNLRQYRSATAFKRAVVGFLMANWHPILPTFWNGLRTKIK
jgi:glycosyltransferase involved in cell wall biosynthesis